MKSDKNKLMIKQLDNKISELKYIEPPSSGWINAIRVSVRMSLKQLSKKLNVSIQNVNQNEKREQEGTISINSLRKIASAMDMKFVYGFIPKEGTLEKKLEERAYQIAKEIVLKTSHSMKLEDQENTNKRIEEAIKERANSILYEMPKYLWD